MFTLEDLDLTAELEYFLVHGTDVLSADSGTDTEADARLHPSDYLIVGA